MLLQFFVKFLFLHLAYTALSYGTDGDQSIRSFYKWRTIWGAHVHWENLEEKLFIEMWLLVSHLSSHAPPPPMLDFLHPQSRICSETGTWKILLQFLISSKPPLPRRRWWSGSGFVGKTGTWKKVLFQLLMMSSKAPPPRRRWWSGSGCEHHHHLALCCVREAPA